MSLQIDDLDQIDGESAQTSNDDIFNNPLEAFPEFLDDSSYEAKLSAASAATAVQETEEPEPDVIQPAGQTSKDEPVSKPSNRSSSAYIDPLDTIEEIDLSILSQSSEVLSFDDDSAANPHDENQESFFVKSNLTLGSIEYEDVAVRQSDLYYDIDDSVPDAMETEEISVDSFLSSTGTETEEIDLDSFLGDSDFSVPESSSGQTEEVSIDDFLDFSGLDADAGIDSAAIDAFAASTRQPKQEKSDIENAPAIDMELEFDDEFVLETKANPEDDIDFDFEALMTGESISVPQQETTGIDVLDNFDDIFDNIVDEGSPSSEASSDGIDFDPSAIEEVSLDAFGLIGSSAPDSVSAASGESIAEQQITFDDVTEFDDLLSSFSDDTHVEVAEKQTARQDTAGPHDYNIIVIMEDDEVSQSVSIPSLMSENDDDEDYVISIFKTSEDAEKYRNHGSSDSSVNNSDTSFSPSGFSGNSGTFEDISLDDFGVSFEDITPAASHEEHAEESFDDTSAPSVESVPEDEPELMEENESESIPEGLDIPDEEPDFSSLDMPDLSDESEADTISEIPVDEPEIILETFTEVQDEPEPAPETFTEVLDEPEFIPEMPAEQEISFEEQFGEVPTVESILKEAETLDDVDEITNAESLIDNDIAADDNLSDDKIIVEKSEISVYNGDNTEDTSNMINGNNEEITDTMNEGLLEKIVSELSVLRHEMQNLRDEVQTLKGVSSIEEPSVDDAFEESVIEEPAVEEASAEEFVLPEDDVVTEETAADDFAIPEENVSEDFTIPEAEAPAEEAGGFFSGNDDDETIALSGDELNNILNSADFTQEDGSNFGVEPAEGAILPEDLDTDISLDSPVEESEPLIEEIAEVPSDDVTFEETPSEEVPVEETPLTEDFDINFDEPSEEAPAEEAVSEEPVFDEAIPSFEEETADDFNTDLPSLKEDNPESVEEVVTEEPVSEAEEESFTLDDFDIPEPAVEEDSIENIEIDEPEETVSDVSEEVPDSFSLDDFDIPEPTVDETSVTDIDIDEPSAEIPSEEPVNAEENDFYANSDEPSIPEEDISTIDIQENLEEPVLDDIDFNLDETASEDIDIPAGDTLVVDSSPSDFLEEDDPTLDEQLTTEKVDYLNEDAVVSDIDTLPEIEDIPESVEESVVEGMEDSLESDTLATSEDETPAEDVFSSQWDSTPVATPSFDDNPEEEMVQAASSFDDSIGFDIEEIPEEETIVEETVPADIDLEEPSESESEPEPVFEEPVAETVPSDDFSSDLKQEVKSVLKYMDQLLENLPEDKIAEFAQSEHFETYKKLFNELGLV